MGWNLLVVEFSKASKQFIQFKQINIDGLFVHQFYRMIFWLPNIYYPPLDTLIFDFNISLPPLLLLLLLSPPSTTITTAAPHIYILTTQSNTLYTYCANYTQILAHTHRERQGQRPKHIRTIADNHVVRVCFDKQTSAHTVRITLLEHFVLVERQW